MTLFMKHQSQKNEKVLKRKRNSIFQLDDENWHQQTETQHNAISFYRLVSDQFDSISEGFQSFNGIKTKNSHM